MIIINNIIIYRFNSGSPTTLNLRQEQYYTIAKQNGEKPEWTNLLFSIHSKGGIIS